MPSEAMGITPSFPDEGRAYAKAAWQVARLVLEPRAIQLQSSCGLCGTGYPAQRQGTNTYGGYRASLGGWGHWDATDQEKTCEVWDRLVVNRLPLPSLCTGGMLPNFLCPPGECLLQDLAQLLPSENLP